MNISTAFTPAKRHGIHRPDREPSRGSLAAFSQRKMPAQGSGARRPLLASIPAGGSPLSQTAKIQPVDRTQQRQQAVGGASLPPAFPKAPPS